ncbi:MAG: FtsQ-type POTRA domain-containing protein [Gemmatimonadetes bacterium]|nr:FtsQ-type POTRA domain-containing protein [Gemmatimonadota bacterium]
MLKDPRLWGVVVLVMVAVAALHQAPRLLRGFDAFHVTRVEVVGTRYLAPHDALGVSGITRHSSTFDDPQRWLRALRRHPLVQDARIRRRLPGTLVLEITEVQPVALIRTPELQPVDGQARALPIDPIESDLDLPLLPGVSDVGEDRRLTSRRHRELIAALERIRSFEPGVAAELSELEPLAGGGLRLRLRTPAHAEVLLPPQPEALGLQQLRLALADLSARNERAAVRRIDVRFHDQVVVSLAAGAAVEPAGADRGPGHNPEP